METIYSDMLDTTIDCRIKKGWDRENRHGICYGKILINNMPWGIVKWDDEEDPDLVKADALEIYQPKWVSLL